jgi:hypothetical protein
MGNTLRKKKKNTNNKHNNDNNNDNSRRIERTNSKFAKEDLFELIFLMNPEKWAEMKSKEKDYSCEELRIIIKEIMSTPGLRKNSVSSLTASKADMIKKITYVKESDTDTSPLPAN